MEKQMKHEDQINTRVLDHLDRDPRVGDQKLVELYGNRDARDRSLSHIRKVRRWWERQGGSRRKP
jgi:hypothetical protein